MKTLAIVLPGGTRGIGLGMARNFLDRGHRICITGRSVESVGAALTELDAASRDGRAMGVACDVGALDQVQASYEAAAKAFGQVDIWINNAGVANLMADFETIAREEYENVVRTNIIGTLNGCKVALAAMKKQGHGQIYNFEGFGSDGRLNNGLSVYGMTKRAITYFTAALIKENQNQPVNVGYMSPGIVITDMVTQEAEHMSKDRWERTKRIYNIIADPADIVTPWLADAVIADVGKHGSALRYLTPRKAAWRFFKAFVLRQKRDLFSELGI